MRLRHNGWIRRSVSIPKGFLSYGALRILSRTPMSGSELMEEIERRTGWRPSPGSIYPLLAKLKEGSLIEEAESKETCMKRFSLTEKGKEMLKEYDRRREVFKRKFHSIRRIWLKIYREMDEDLYQSSVRLFEALESISPHLKKETTDKIRSILIKAADEIEELRKSLEAGEKS